MIGSLEYAPVRSLFRKLRLAALALTALCTSGVGIAAAYGMNYYGVPAINMRHFGNNPGSEFNLMLVQASGEFVHGLNLPHGKQICEFMFLGRDNDPNPDNNAIAQLERKRFTRNSDPFDAPQILARVRSRGMRDIFREFSTTNIRHPVIDSDNFLYNVRLNLPANNSIEAVRLGVMLASTCP